MRIGLIQLTAGSEKEKNLSKVEMLVEECAEKRPDLICLPENFNFIGSTTATHKQAESVSTSQTLARMKTLAEKWAIHLVAGGIAIACDQNKHFNSTFVIDPKGEIIARYDKIHLFDFIGKGMIESDFVNPGREPIVVDLPWCRFGITTCYDLRFPELYRRLTLIGAKVILVPSAFLEHTGMNHWEALLKARAIENQIYVAAPNQYGEHFPGRVSYGRSLIAGPWGEVLAKAENRETSIVADIDLVYLEKVRQALPVLNHIRKDLFNLA